MNRLAKFALSALAAGGVIHVAYGLGYQWYSAASKSEMTMAVDFETGDLNQWPGAHARQFCCGHSVTVENETVRTGKYAARIQLNATDPDVKSSKRAEFRLKAVPMKTTLQYAFSVFVPKDWTRDTIPVTVAQWHAVPDKLLFEGGRTPPLRIAILGDEWFVVAHWDDARVSRFFFEDEQPKHFAVLWRGAVAWGQWTDWLVVVHWSYGDDGRVVVRKDGVVMAQRSGPNTYNDNLAPYFKLGLYVPDWRYMSKPIKATHREIYLDDIKVDVPRRED